MVQQRVQHFLWQKSGTYYFVRRVPKDIQEYYTSSRVVICLKTKRRDSAVKASRSIAQRLEDYWLSLRLTKLDIPALHLLRDKTLSATSSSMTLSEALELYLRLKGSNKDKVFHRGAERNIHSFRHSLRDRIRAVQCPSDMIDQIGGWSTAGVRQAYGLGYSLEKKWEWLFLLEN